MYMTSLDMDVSENSIPNCANFNRQMFVSCRAVSCCVVEVEDYTVCVLMVYMLKMCSAVMQLEARSVYRPNLHLFCLSLRKSS